MFGRQLPSATMAQNDSNRSGTDIRNRFLGVAVDLNCSGEGDEKNWAEDGHNQKREPTRDGAGKLHAVARRGLRRRSSMTAEQTPAGGRAS